MTEGRWERLAADLEVAGFDAKVDGRPYSEFYRGRPRSGVSYSITFRVPGKGLVEVSDKFWAKNLDTWLGWTVTAENSESITIGRPSWASKKRSETVKAVRRAFQALQESE